MTDETNPIRVLVVENDPLWRSDHKRNLHRWGYQPFVVEGDGEQLLAATRAVARQTRSQLALVDMRLVDDTNRDDISGLELVAALQPTVAIIVSGSDDRQKVVNALLKYKAINFVGKEDGPEALKSAIAEAIDQHAIGGRHLAIFWPPGLSAAAICDQMFPDQPDIPADEIDDLIRRLFPEAAQIRLTLVADDREASDTASPAATTVLRRKSRVFLAEIDNQPAQLIVKLADPHKIQREAENFDRYVKRGLASSYRPHKENEFILWDVGAIVYTFLGATSIGRPNGPRTLTSFFRQAISAGQILQPLNAFFDLQGWGHWYRAAVKPLAQDLVTAYDDIWQQALSQHYAAWQIQASERYFGTFPVRMPNPLRWFVDNRQHCADLHLLRQAITHGDLHGDNLFVDHHAWPIDFERTGYGPILRDFVELIQDLATRVARLSADELPLVYELAVAVCSPAQPRQAMRSTPAIAAHPEARKLFGVVQELQLLAAERAQYDDRREYLWGLLCNHLFVASKLQPESPRWLQTMLFAAVICQRLKRWNRSDWLPDNWPPVAFVDPADDQDAASDGPKSPDAGPTAASLIIPPDPPPVAGTIFQHGYALLIGVGEVAQHPRLSLPVTVNDANALQAAFTDPQRCAYPAHQVRLLTNAGASLPAIREGLAWLAHCAQYDPESTVIVYFSGHGVRTPDERYALVVADTHPQIPSSLLWHDELTQLVRAISARRLLVLLDACHAAGMTPAKDAPLLPGANYTKAAPAPDLLAGLAQGRGRAVLSASGVDQSSYYVPGEPLSIFTRHLLDALSGVASRPGDTTVSLAVVQRHVGTAVPAEVRRRYNAEQTPWIDQSGEDFPLALLIGGKGLPATTTGS